jgi:hypothetical protein
LTPPPFIRQSPGRRGRVRAGNPTSQRCRTGSSWPTGRVRSNNLDPRKPSRSTFRDRPFDAAYRALLARSLSIASCVCFSSRYTSPARVSSHGASPFSRVAAATFTNSL